MDPDLHCRIFVVSPVCEFRGDVIALALRVLGLRVPRARGDDNKTLFCAGKGGKAPILSPFFLGFWVIKILAVVLKSGESEAEYCFPACDICSRILLPNHVRTT